MSEEKDKLDPEMLNLVRIFHKVGGYYKWTWKEFRETPWWVIKGLCMILDEPGDDLSKFIGYEEFGEYRNLLRLHGGGDKSS